MYTVKDRKIICMAVAEIVFYLSSPSILIHSEYTDNPWMLIFLHFAEQQIKTFSESMERPAMNFYTKYV